MKTSRHCTRYSTRKLDCTNARHILVCNVRNTQSRPLHLAMMRPPLAALIVSCVACRTLTQLSLCSCCGTFSRTLDPCLAYFRELHATMLSQHLCLNFQDTVVEHLTHVPPRQYCLMFHFLKSSWRSLLRETRFLAWNSPNTVWWPGSARTRWGS